VIVKVSYYFSECKMSDLCAKNWRKKLFSDTRMYKNREKNFFSDTTMYK